MVSIRFTKMEVQELKLWAHYNREKQEETGLRWEEDQQRIVEKLDNAIKKPSESETGGKPNRLERSLDGLSGVDSNQPLGKSNGLHGVKATAGTIPADSDTADISCTSHRKKATGGGT